MRNKHLLLWSSILTLALLGAAAVHENFFREWRRVQQSASRPGAPADVRLRQVYVPSLGAADRCVSCHVGMSPGEQAIPGDKVLGPHPKVAHEPADIGCTVCHGGQGRATDRADAHGEAPFWPEPMLPRRYSWAGCGGCHTPLGVPEAAHLRAGAAVFEREDCLACHKLDGRGGTVRPDGGGMEGPDLSASGLRVVAAGWWASHLDKSAKAPAAPWKGSVRALPAAEREALDTFLATRVGAPGLSEAKALFHTLGCRGCHKVNGVGGADGPDLTREGRLDPGRLDFAHVPGGRTVPAWLAEHFRAPATLVPNSQMPALGLSEKEIDGLVLYLLSLRTGGPAGAVFTPDRMRVERFGAREFATDGATLYAAFCSGCHGAQGEGMRYAGMAAFPAIGNPDFLSLVSDEFLATTIDKGRPGRRMAGWADPASGLRPEERRAVIAFVRALGGGAATPSSTAEPRRFVSPALKGGDVLYARSCAGCHGAKGQGAEGPALANPVLLESASDRYLVETIRRGRRGTSMEGFATPSSTRASLTDPEIESVVALIRTWEKTR
jgi:mono/diheme cytochrome c family protein